MGDSRLKKTVANLPNDHLLKEFGERFGLCVHDNGECRLDRSGFGGAEYHGERALLERISQFIDFGVSVSVTIYPVSGDKKTDFYEATPDIKSYWRGQLQSIGVKYVVFDIANKLDSEGGMAHIPEFYAHRDHDDVGIYALSKSALEKRVPMELELGFDSCVSNSLYQSST